MPAAAGAVLAITVLVDRGDPAPGRAHVGSAWLLAGLGSTPISAGRQGKSLTQRFTIPDDRPREAPDLEYGSILVPVFGEELDDDIIGTAGRLAAEQAMRRRAARARGAVGFQIPMSLPIDARVPDERVKEAKRALSRAKEVGEEYEGVEVATAMVRGRSAGAAIVSEAKRRGVEAIVLAAEEPTRTRAGRCWAVAPRRDRFAGDYTRYVVEKATCTVILTAPAADHDDERRAIAATS